MTDEENGGIVREARSLIEDYVKAEVITIIEPDTGTKIAAIRKGATVEPVPPAWFDPYRDVPLSRRGTAKMLSLASFIDHTNRFKDTESVVFANDDRAAPALTSVIDYNHAGEDMAVVPRHGRHRATYAFPLSDEWKVWTKASGTVMTMADFAAFLEDHLIDVAFVAHDSLPEDVQRAQEALGGGAVATPNKLMELARGLQINEESVAREAVNLQSGEAVLQFEAKHTDSAGGPVKVPSLFMIVIPVFKSGEAFRLAARLRYRKKDGRILFWFDLWRIDRTFDMAFQDAVAKVIAETALPVLFGSPEV